VRTLEPAAKEAERLQLELAERETELRQAKQLKMDLLDQKAEMEAVALRWQTEVARLQVGGGAGPWGSTITTIVIRVHSAPQAIRLLAQQGFGVTTSKLQDGGAAVPGQAAALQQWAGGR
jgi:hypothetical protein